MNCEKCFYKEWTYCPNEHCVYHLNNLQGTFTKIDICVDDDKKIIENNIKKQEAQKLFLKSLNKRQKNSKLKSKG